MSDDLHNHQFNKNKKNAYCAFCKSPRKVYTKKHINFFDIISSAVLAAAIMYLLWHGFDAKVVMIFAFIVGVSDLFIQLRWRASISCPYCGFDPVLYIRNSDMAVQKVKAFLEKKKVDPKYLLSRPLDLPTIEPEKARALQNKGQKGQLVSRQL